MQFPSLSIANMSAQQISLLAAGCQPWNFQVVAASSNRFAYCATLAVYIFEKVSQGNYQLHSIMTEHKRTITSICWHPSDADILCTTSCDKSIIIWNIPQQKMMYQVNNLTENPVAAGFMDQHLAFASKRSTILFWNYSEGKVSSRKDYDVSFSSDITVISICKKQNGRVLVGHSDGSISLLCQGRKPHKNVLMSYPDNTTEDHSVINIQWDDNSTDYALVVRYQCDLLLIDTNSMATIMTYNVPSKAAHIQTVSWIPNSAGMFVTGDQKTGLLRLWNVSSSNPLESIKSKSAGFHTLVAIENEEGSVLQPDSVKGHLRSAHKRTPIPPALIVCAYLDGGVGFYDLGRKSWVFLREQGHIETIFDCKFSPKNPNKLATVSFDGSVKVWDISHTDVRFEDCSPGNEGILYSISWAPYDLNAIAVASAKYGVFIWDITKKKITQRFHEHGVEVVVYCVSWNQLNTRKVLSGGADKNAIVRDVDGSNVVKFPHPGTVYGCDWSPGNPSLFATGCEDFHVRIFCLPMTSQAKPDSYQPLKVFSGHSSKAFHVKWSPLRDGYLASGGDDMVIRVWSYSDQKCIQKLIEHSGPVRGLCWSPELVYLLYSGSWDCTIRLWDIRFGSCICCLDDHGGDVYGLSVHPLQPFILASCSRDSTVRVWSTYKAVAPLLHTKLLLSLETTKVFGYADSIKNLNKYDASLQTDQPALLCGRASHEVKQRSSCSSPEDRVLYLQRVSTLFQCPIGLENLYDLTKVILRISEASLSENYPKGVKHLSHVSKYKQAEACDLEMAAMVHQTGHAHSSKREELLNKAAENYLLLGNFQKYCDLMVEQNQWEKALSLAPAVSMKYWRQLVDKYSRILQSSEPCLAIPYLLAAGDIKDAIHFYVKTNKYAEAILFAATYKDGVLNDSQPKITGENACLSQGDMESKTTLLESTIEKLGEFYLLNGQPVMSACVYLSANQIQRCLESLVRGHCLELALGLASLFDVSSSATLHAAERLAQRCQKMDQWQTAMCILKKFSGRRRALLKLCIELGSDIKDHDLIRKEAGLPSIEEACRSCRVASGDTVQQITNLFLSSQPSDGLEMAVSILADMIKSPITTECIDLLECTQSLGIETLNKHPVILHELLTISCYLGGLRAAFCHFSSLVPFLLELVKKRLLAVKTSKFPFSVEKIQEDILLYTDSGDKSLLSRFSDDYTEHVVPGCVYTQSCGLPCKSSNNRVSLITGQLILGGFHVLADGASMISLNEAIMWSNLIPFCPTTCLQAKPVATKMNPV